MNVNTKNREFLLENVPNAVELMQGDGVDAINTLLYELNEVIMDKGFDDEGDYNAFGNKAQEVYDDIYEFA
jgi:hypothetical protein